MNKKISICLFLFVFLHIRAAAVPYVDDTINKWRNYVVSELIDPEGKEVSRDSVADFFKGKEIIIDKRNVIVSGLCKYEYALKKLTPLDYWYNPDVVNLYKKLLSDHQVFLKKELSLITPLKTSTDCPYPFSYFIRIDDSLVFVINNRMVIYSRGKNKLKSSTNACVSKKKTIEEIYESGDVTECFYEKNILNAYKTYRSSLIHGKEYLLKKIHYNENLVVSCNDGCIEVSYKWSDKNNLEITQLFNGGKTDVKLTQEVLGTRIIIRSYPD